MFALYRLVATEDAVAELAERYRSGSVAYRDAKELLIEAHEARFGRARDHVRDLRADQAYLRSVLAEGAERARVEVRQRLDRARAAVGIVESMARPRAEG